VRPTRLDRRSGGGLACRVMLRRDLVRLLVLLSGGLACRVAEPARIPGPTRRVVVVGAGIAGLTVARLLQAADIEVVVLEARDRIGGRTHTLALAGAKIDVGAAWIHGRRGNPVAALVDGLGLVTREHAYADDDARFWDAAEGRALTDEEAAAARVHEDAIDEQLASLRSRLPDDASMQDAIDLYLKDLGLKPSAERQARFVLEQFLLEVDYGGPASRTSLSIFDEDEFFGYDDHLIAGGYGKLLAALAEGLEIHTSTPAVRIDYDELAVRVETATGEAFAADRVIVTVPLGVLQAGTIELRPALPADKLAAIGRLEMSSLEKVVLCFDDVFWPEAGDNAAWLHAGQERGEFPLVVDFTRDAGAPTLVLMHGGTRVREQLDERDDAGLVADALAVLGQLFERPIPTPVASHVTRWRSDPWSRGSYCFPALGQSMADFDRLAAPVADRVLFAGEATSRPYFGTVHGAVHSAIREATRLGVDTSGLPGL